MAHVGLIVFMIIAIVLLFTAMVFSTMAAVDARKSDEKCRKNCHQFSTWSALITGLSVAVIVVTLIVYMYSSRHEIAGMVQPHVANLHNALGGMANHQGTHSVSHVYSPDFE